MLTCHRHRLPPTNPHSTLPPPREGHVAIGRAVPGHHEPGGAPCRLGRRLSRPAGLMLPSGWRAPRRGARSSDAFERVLRSIRGVNHSGGRLQVMRSRKTACEPAPPTPSTHANVQTSKVSPPRTALLTNLPCRTRQGKARQVRKPVELCAVESRRRVLSRELGGCKGSRAQHVETRERAHRHKVSTTQSRIVS